MFGMGRYLKPDHIQGFGCFGLCNQVRSFSDFLSMSDDLRRPLPVWIFRFSFVRAKSVRRTEDIDLFKRHVKPVFQGDKVYERTKMKQLI